MKIKATLVAFVALVLAPAAAHATHKSWILTDSSANCRPQSYSTTNDGWNGAFGNMTSNAAWAVCPVTLGGIFASNGSGYGVFDRAEWALAKRAEIYVYDGNTSSDIQCSAAAVTMTGSILWSRTVWTSGTGAQTLRVYDTATRSWGGMLGQSQQDIRSLAYRCWMPAPGPYISLITGYATTLCQRDFCFDAT